MTKTSDKKFKRRKVYARFKGNIWAKDLAEMGSLSSMNHGVKCLLCVINVFTEYVYVRPLKDKKAKTVLHGFIQLVNEFKFKPNKLWADQGKELFNGLMQK